MVLYFVDEIFYNEIFNAEIYQRIEQMKRISFKDENVGATSLSRAGRHAEGIPRLQTLFTEGFIINRRVTSGWMKICQQMLDADEADLRLFDLPFAICHLLIFKGGSL